MSERSGLVGSAQARAQEIVREDYQQARTLAKDAARSGSYLYPIKGIVYLVTHRALWRPFASRILPTLGLSAAVLIPMFTFTYLPQFAVLVFLNGPLAVFTTVVLILNESSTIVSIISRRFLLQEALLDTFDGTLVARGATGIVQEGRQLQPGVDPIAKLGKILKSPFEKFSPTALIRYIMYLPLNVIPVVGTAIFLFLQGKSRGRTIHDRYFQLKGWDSNRRSAWLDAHAGSYMVFGTIATLLELVPFVSIFFSFTNTVGAALWAADVEAKSGGQPGEETDKTE